MKRISIAKRLATAAVAGTLALAQPVVADAAAGGFHGGGFHGGGFHGGGFHAGGVHAGGLHAGGIYGGFHGRGFHAGGIGGFHPYHGAHVWWGGGGLSAPYLWDWDNGQYVYYCADPQGYYPYVTQCFTGWYPVPSD
jgi:hypothetical protein